MSEKQKVADNQKVAGSEGREPTEGKWVAEPREPDAKDGGADGITRLTSEDRADSKNPQNLKGPNADDVDEKVVEAGVADSVLNAETEVSLTPKAI